MSTKITEIIPDEIPEWASKAIEEGQFFRIAIEKVEQLTQGSKDLSSREANIWKMRRDRAEEEADQLNKTVSLLTTECENRLQAIIMYRKVLQEADEYLDSNRLNQIGSGSILHRNMKSALNGHS